MTDDDYTPESGRRADPQRIVQAIDRARDNHATHPDQDRDRGNRNRRLKWDDKRARQIVRQAFTGNPRQDEAILPGFGPQGLGNNTRDDCGNPHPFVCGECGHTVEFGSTCGMSVCARCGVAWVRDTAINKAAKLRRVRKEKHQSTPSSEHQKLHHLVISPPLSWYSHLADAGLNLEEAQQATKPVVKKILDELRGQGLLVRHSYRGARDDGTIRSESDDRGAWKERLNSGRQWVDDVRDQLAWKPHYHAVVASDYIKGGDLTDHVEEQTGWVIHRIADDNGISLANDGAMARAVTYTLSHTDIDVRDNHNRSCAWEIGSFEGDPIKSSSRFTPWDADTEWADAAVRRHVAQTLGLTDSSTECNATIPPVDDPDELARQIIEDLYPGSNDPPGEVDTDDVLDAVHRGHLTVTVSTNTGGGGNVTVTDAWGNTRPSNGWWSTPDTAWTTGGSSTTIDPTTVADDALEADHADTCECDDCDQDAETDVSTDAREPGTDVSVNDTQETCTGTLIPLEEFRQRELLDDLEWCRQAANVDEAREADREWPDDLDPWQTDHPGHAIGTG